MEQFWYIHYFHKGLIWYSSLKAAHSTNIFTMVMLRIQSTCSFEVEYAPGLNTSTSLKHCILDQRFECISVFVHYYRNTVFLRTMLILCIWLTFYSFGKEFNFLEQRKQTHKSCFWGGQKTPRNVKSPLDLKFLMQE